jgi:outer membrane protein OmpA-like peptidoglycan-associated protein
VHALRQAILVPLSCHWRVLKKRPLLVETPGMTDYCIVSRVLLSGLWLGAMLFGAPAAAHLQRFEASWEASRWEVESTHGHCALVHDIPRFGQARFEQRAGRWLEFALHAQQPLILAQRAQLQSLAPPWKKQPFEERLLGEFMLEPGRTPLRIPRQQALRIYYELEQGMKPLIEFSDGGDGADQVQVAFVPVRFREALPRFLECTAGLLYLDFEPLSEKTVYFSTDSDRLSRSAQRVLEQVARDVRGNRERRIVLGGHADERGGPDYNAELSRRRAAMVARYLRSRGVARAAIESRYFGENQPEDPTNTTEAWARNRRVTIWLAEKQAARH